MVSTRPVLTPSSNSWIAIVIAAIALLPLVAHAGEKPDRITFDEFVPSSAPAEGDSPRGKLTASWNLRQPATPLSAEDTLRFVKITSMSLGYASEEDRLAAAERDAAAFNALRSFGVTFFAEFESQVTGEGTIRARAPLFVQIVRGKLTINHPTLGKIPIDYQTFAELDPWVQADPSTPEPKKWWWVDQAVIRGNVNADPQPPDAIPPTPEYINEHPNTGQSNSEKECGMWDIPGTSGEPWNDPRKQNTTIEISHDFQSWIFWGFGPPATAQHSPLGRFEWEFTLTMEVKTSLDTTPPPVITGFKQKWIDAPKTIEKEPVGFLIKTNYPNWLIKP